MTPDTIILDIIPMEDLHQLQVFEGGRWQFRFGAVYAYKAKDGNYILHMLSEKTDREWFNRMFEQKRLYVPKQRIQAEQS